MSIPLTEYKLNHPCVNKARAWKSEVKTVESSVLARQILEIFILTLTIHSSLSERIQRDLSKTNISARIRTSTRAPTPSGRTTLVPSVNAHWNRGHRRMEIDHEKYEQETGYRQSWQKRWSTKLTIFMANCAKNSATIGPTTSMFPQ